MGQELLAGPGWACVPPEINNSVISPAKHFLRRVTRVMEESETLEAVTPRQSAQRVIDDFSIIV